MLVKINTKYIVTPKFKNTTEQIVGFSREMEGCEHLLFYTNILESAEFMICPCTDHEVSHLQYYVNLESVPRPCHDRHGLGISYFQLHEILTLPNNISYSDKTLKSIRLSKWDVGKFVDVDSSKIQKKIKLSQSSINDFLFKNGWEIDDYQDFEYCIDAPVKIKPIT